MYGILCFMLSYDRRSSMIVDYDLYDHRLIILFLGVFEHEILKAKSLFLFCFKNLCFILDLKDVIF